jgi:hypothetical protein
MVPICNKNKQICVNILDLSTLKDFQKFGVLGLKSKEGERESVTRVAQLEVVYLTQ